MSIADEFNGFNIRPGTYDYEIVLEMNGYKIINFKNKSVMDIGGNIGAFARLAFNEGAASVVSFEPDPDNFKLLAKNKNDRAHIIVNRAVVKGSDKERLLYVNSKTNKGTHTLIPTRGRDAIQIECIDFAVILDAYKPEVLKIDIEGAEYEIIERSLPNYVKQFFIEYHLTRKGQREKAIKIHNLICQDFDCVKEPKLNGNAWASLAYYTRKIK